MGPAGHQGDLHVGDGGAGEDSQVGLFLQMSHNQPLPAPVQLVLAAPGGRHHAAALGQGLQQQMHLRIVPQGFKVAHALHGAVDGLLIQNPAPVQVDLHAEALRHQTFENFRLDAAHQGHMNFPSVGGEAQLGILLLQLAQLGQQGAAVAVRRQGHPIAHHRLQHRPDTGFLRPQALAAAGGRQSLDGAHASGGDLVHRPEPAAAVKAQLGGLLLVPGIGHGVPDPQGPAGDLQVGQALALGVVADLEHPGGEGSGIGRRFHIPGQPLQKFVDALQLQPGAEPTGKNQPPPHQLPHQGVGDLSAVQIRLQGILPAGGQLLHAPLPVRGGEVHAPLPQFVVQMLHHLPPAAAAEVHFRHKQKRGDPVQLQQPPQSAGVGLDAVGAADHQNGVVQHRQGALHLGGEVHMARGVQQRHLQIPDGQLRLAGKDGDAPLPLQQMAVHGGAAVVHPAQLPQLAGAVEHGLGQGGFARVHMGGDADDHPAGLVAVCIHMQNLLCLIFLYYGRYRPGLQGRIFSCPAGQIVL